MIKLKDLKIGDEVWCYCTTVKWDMYGYDYELTSIERLEVCKIIMDRDKEKPEVYGDHEVERMGGIFSGTYIRREKAEILAAFKTKKEAKEWLKNLEKKKQNVAEEIDRLKKSLTI